MNARTFLDRNILRWLGESVIPIAALLAILIPPHWAAAQNQNECRRAQSLIESARLLNQQGQNLLSTIQFSLAAFFDCPELLHRALYSEALSLQRLGETQIAFSILDRVEAEGPAEMRDSSRLFRAWLSPDPPNLAKLNADQLARLATWNEREKQFPGPKKTPWIAAVGSAMLPGSGQLYGSPSNLCVSDRI